MPFATQFDETKTADTKLVFIFDEDDPDLDVYKAKLAGRWEYFVAEASRRGMVGALNCAYTEYARNGLLGFAVGFMGDDHRPRTVGWDENYLEALRSLRSGFVYGNDLLQGELMPTQVAMTSDIPRSLKYMCPPELDHLCVDLVWLDWGKAVDRITYLPETVVEHMHPLANKATYDKNYRAVNSNYMARHDNQGYHAYHETRFQEDVGRITMMLERSWVEDW